MSQYKIWECQVCAWIYDEAKGCPAEGLASGTRWEDIPNDWVCPECGVAKSDFEMIAISDAIPASSIVKNPVTATNEVYEYSIWECQVCAWIYDESLGWPADGIAPGTKWQDIPADWVCPECGVEKSDFEMLETKRVQVTTEHAASSVSTVEVAVSAESELNAFDPSQAPIVIIGSGLAAYNLVKEIRKTELNTAIYLYTIDDGSFYSKPLLSTGFAKNKTAAELASQSAEHMAEQYKVQIHIFSQVTAVDTTNKSITVGQNGSQAYSKLVFATGASCIQPPLTGNGLQHVYSVNNLLDYAKFRTIAKHKKKILIIGAGLIGSEYANDLLQAGYQIDVVDPMPSVLTSLLPQQASLSVENALRKAGANFHFGTVVKQIEQHQSGIIATLENNTQIQADLVLSAIGVRPNISLAKAANIRVERGIVTDKSLQTSVTDVYAIGDCAQVENHVLFYILPLMAQVRALAKTLAGEKTLVSYPAMPVMVKTTLFPVVVNPPARQSDGSLVAGTWVIEQQSERGIKAVYRQGEQVLGFALTGDQVSAKVQLEKLCPTIMN
ncbi:FAD-dependent oxidoreductase [Paraglaciecola hydrolytica]|uniref:Rubredoxin-like domain-containing protein n=1 Tax=Paraglaciecola hydrolytica TaxID=1799789 RepID=A0A136A5A1_9ALTE|nr:FAD-dependent oxidoreductase [Paraglaciecola hydrolytica]KXI30422.1 hypothetical protein AX660_10680 [Paraglaciecola hydrolytica]